MKRNLLLLFAFFAMAFSANAQFTSIAIVGPAVGGWPDSNPDPHVMTQVDADNWTIDIAMVPGMFKFRADNSWSDPTTWGTPTAGTGWPSGTAVHPGNDIACTATGTFTLTFNSATGVYNFGGAVAPPVVTLVGTATSADVPFITTDATIYTASNVTLLAGDAQFRVDFGDGTIVLVGATTFPDGFAEEGINIPVTAGTYSTITINISDSSYHFTAAAVFNSVAIVGTGAGGWPGTPGNPGPLDINQLSTTDGITYTGNVTLTAVDGSTPGSGEIKFRQNNSWDAPNLNWGGDAFPVGTASTTGGNIVVTAPGNYYVTFNTTTLAYTFSFPSVSLVGPAVGGWPGTPGNPGPIDIIQLTTTDGENYAINNLTIADGEAKFRLNNDWTTSWGDPSSSNGNIFLTAGTYNVTFIRSTGVYNFTALATASFAKAGFKVYPNPTQNNWNFSSEKGNIQSVQIIDMLGKTIMTVAPADANATVDASSLNAGMYFARIATATATETVKLVKN